MTKVYNPPPNWPQPPAGWQPPSGWRPDPGWGPAPEGWQFYVDAPWAPPEEPEKPKRGRRFALFAGLFVAAVIGTVLLMGGRFGALEIGPESVRLEFDHSAAGEGASEEAVEGAQSDLEERMAEFEEEAQNQSTPTGPSDVTVSGVWQGDNGFTYVFQQYGAAFTWREEAPAYGITAVGNGFVDGTYVYIQFQAYDGSTGYAELTFDGQALRGTFTNAAFAGVPIAMFRAG
jgi:hypothetical protein